VDVGVFWKGVLIDCELLYTGLKLLTIAPLPTSPAEKEGCVDVVMFVGVLCVAVGVVVTVGFVALFSGALLLDVFGLLDDVAPAFAPPPESSS
jgi:hypothetical protein